MSPLCSRGVPCAVRPVLRALLRCLSERIAAGSHGDEPGRRHEDASRRHRRFWCAQSDRAIHSALFHRMPLHNSGGAFFGTLATHPLAPVPTLKESFVAPEKMEPAFKVCAPCSLAAQSRLLSPPSTPPPILCCRRRRPPAGHLHRRLQGALPREQPRRQAW